MCTPTQTTETSTPTKQSNMYFCYCSAFKYVLYKVNYAVHCMFTVVLSVRIISNVTCAVYTGLLRNKFHSSNRHDIHNLIAEKLVSYRETKRGSTGCWWPYLSRFPKLWSRTFVYRTDLSAASEDCLTSKMSVKALAQVGISIIFTGL